MNFSVGETFVKNLINIVKNWKNYPHMKISMFTVFRCISGHVRCRDGGGMADGPILGGM